MGTIESLLFSNECFYLFARSICGCRPLLSIGEVDNRRSALLISKATKQKGKALRPLARNVKLRELPKRTTASPDLGLLRSRRDHYEAGR